MGKAMDLFGPKSPDYPHKVEDMAQYLIWFGPHPSPTLQGCSQAIFRFPNGYGASVISGGMFSVGSKTSEIMALKFYGPNRKDYNPIGSSLDVYSKEQGASILGQIRYGNIPV